MWMKWNRSYGKNQETDDMAKNTPAHKRRGIFYLFFAVTGGHASPMRVSCAICPEQHAMYDGPCGAIIRAG